LNHSDGEAEKFYRELAQRGVSVRVGMEATGLFPLGSSVCWQNWDRGMDRRLPRRSKPGESASRRPTANDAQLLLQLLLDNNFPQIWVPSPENRDLRQLLGIGIG